MAARYCGTAYALPRNGRSGQVTYISRASCHAGSLDMNPSLAHCLWVQVAHGSTMFLYNMDFAMEWPRPLPPNVQFVGALLPTQAKPLPPKFEVGF